LARGEIVAGAWAMTGPEANRGECSVSTIEVEFLEQGIASQPERVAHDLASFIARARTSLIFGCLVPNSTTR
jgi:hypothetical protein